MKKLLLSLIVPKKMVQYRTLNVFLAVLIFILCVFLSVGPSIFRTEHFLKTHVIESNLTYYLYDSNYELEAGYDSDLPTFSYDDNYQIDQQSVVYKKDNENNNIYVYDIPLTASDQTQLNLKLVYELSKTSKDILDFDLAQYLNGQTPTGEVDMLMVFTKERYYYIYNRGYFTEEKNKGEYYLYDSELNTANAVFVENDNSGVKTYEYIGDNNIYKMFTSKDGVNIIYGTQAYSSFAVTDAHLGAVVGDAATIYNLHSEIMLAETGSYVKFVTYIYSFFYTVIFSLLWVFIIWLMCRRYGELTLFREYYSICSISLILPSTIIGIISFFIPYVNISSFSLIAQVAFFVFCILKINPIKQQKLANPEETKFGESQLKPVDYEVVTSKINNPTKNNGNHSGPSKLE